ncbi:MAG: D-alanyl-D-alanine carboxypeptidase [Bacteroidia bacterium]|nr:D-alanyl-D-alanine carboxypeptidase [Bacteroidia bacterium]
MALLLGALVFASSCSPVSPRMLTKQLRAAEKKFQDHTGFILYDLGKNKNIVTFNDARYFTPASNTKIFTFYTGLKLLGDSVPALRYRISGDSLIFAGTGDPSFLYKNVFDNGRTYTFLKEARPHLYFSPSNFYAPRFGPGWSWDDYNSAYSSERSGLPIYGNFATIKQEGGGLTVMPPVFADSIRQQMQGKRQDLVRHESRNIFDLVSGPKHLNDEWNIPLKLNANLIAGLLADTLQRLVQIVPLQDSLPNILYSVPADSIYKVMMQESDNFIAEQILLMCAGMLADSLDTNIAINYAKENLLADLPDEPVWVDGSGLSRYNLFTPRSIVALWKKVYQAVPRERLFQLLAIGGIAGTIKSSYKADKPYIFGKTGTLSNNHCLSGFLVTKSGKTLIFSFMNNNYTAPTREIRANMESLLWSIYQHY